jgi:hypothetical protein
VIETLAEEIHNIWCKWTTTLMKEEKLSKKRVKRWTEECHIPYKDLSEKMKDKDREIAKQLLTLIKENS